MSDAAPIVYDWDGNPMRVRIIGAVCEGDISGEGHYGYRKESEDADEPTVVFEPAPEAGNTRGERFGDRTAVQLYELGNEDAGVVQVWDDWPHDVPAPGDKFLLADGKWEVDHRVFNPSAEAVLVYAKNPRGGR